MKILLTIANVKFALMLLMSQVLIPMQASLAESVAYIPQAAGGGISVLDLDSYELRPGIDTQSPVTGIAKSPNQKTLYALTPQGDMVLKIERDSGSVMDTVALPLQHARELVSNPSSPMLYALGAGDCRLAVIDRRTFSLLSTVGLTNSCMAALGIAIDPRGEFLYVGVNGQVKKFNAQSLELVQTIELQAPNDFIHGFVIDKRGRDLYAVLNRSVVRIDLRTFREKRTYLIPDQALAYTPPAIHPCGSVVYIPVQGSESARIVALDVINGAYRTASLPASVFSTIDGIAAHPHDLSLIVSISDYFNHSPDIIHIVDSKSLQVTHSVTLEEFLGSRTSVIVDNDANEIFCPTAVPVSVTDQEYP